MQNKKWIDFSVNVQSDKTSFQKTLLYHDTVNESIKMLKNIIEQKNTNIFLLILEGIFSFHVVAYSVLASKLLAIGLTLNAVWYFLFLNFESARLADIKYAEMRKERR